MAPARTRWLVVGAAVVGVLVLGYLFLGFRSDNRAPAGTTVAGVDIGGMSSEEAAQAVSAQLGPLAEKRLRVKALDKTFPLEPASVGLTLDADASVAPAFGHDWNPVTLVRSLFNGPDLPAVAAVDEPLLMAQVGVIADAVDVPPIEPVVDVKQGLAQVTPGTPGRAVDRDATAAALTEAFLRPRAPIQAVVLTVEPTVTPEATEEAVAMVQDAASAPVTVTAGTVTAQIPGKAVARAMSFDSADGVLTPTLDGAILHRSIAEELSPIEVAGRDATFKIRSGKVKVVKSKVGRGVEDADLASAVASVLDKPAAERRVTVPVGVREPALTTEEAKALGIKERISSFTQYFPYAPYRVQNIGQAAERINGTLLKPGETFSLNDTILERTKENGYTEGFVVGEGGVFAEALGGGVSTSATAAWTAAFYAGMERVQTVAHSIYINRYKPGLEATVAWGLFDMKFRNNSPNAVFITSSITNGSITVSFWGTKEYDKIEAEYGERRNIIPFTTIYDESDECLGQGGVDGFTITVDRVFYKDGAEVKREPITTTYKPAPEVLCKAEPKKDKPKKDKPGSGADGGTGTDGGTGGGADGGTDPAPSEQPNGEDTFSNA